MAERRKTVELYQVGFGRDRQQVARDTQTGAWWIRRFVPTYYNWRERVQYFAWTAWDREPHGRFMGDEVARMVTCGLAKPMRYKYAMLPVAA